MKPQSTSPLYPKPELAFPAFAQPICKWMEAANNRPINGSIDGEAAAGTSRYGFNSTTSGQSEAGSADTPVTSPVSPPYWVQGHQRSVSNVSVDSLPGGITLQDNTDEDDAKNKACWAKSVYIEDHVVINGNRTGIGAFVVWNINVETLQVGAMSTILLQLLTASREVQYGFENATPNSMIYDTSSSKPSQTQRLLCHCYHERASYRSFDPSFWRTEGLDCNTF